MDPFVGVDYRDIDEVRPHLVDGRVDYADSAAVRALNRGLLRAACGLHVDWPDDRLTPTVPSRAAQLLRAAALLGRTDCPRLLVDVGTGASCVYALLAARIFANWGVVATEADEVSYAWAVRNVQRNGLESRVRVVKASFDGDIFCAEVLSAIEEVGRAIGQRSVSHVDLVVCNPPFYDEAQSGGPPPKRTRASTNIKYARSEGYCPGGEVSFVARLVRESQRHAQLRGAWCTSLLGHKASAVAVRALPEVSGKDCRVRLLSVRREGAATTRWIFAWQWHVRHSAGEMERRICDLPGAVKEAAGSYLLTQTSWTRRCRRTGKADDCHLHVCADPLELLPCTCPDSRQPDRALFSGLLSSVTSRN